MKPEKNILVIAAHPDDEVLGCGGAIARHTDEGSHVHVLIMVEGATSRHESRDRTAVKENLDGLNKSAHAAAEILGVETLRMEQFPDNRLDSVDRLDLIKVIEEEIDKHQPGIVYTHHIGDVNIDHRILHDSVIAACRPQPDSCVKELAFFEVPSSTEWQPPESAPAFLPNYFIEIEKYLDRKLEALRAYQSELREYPHPRSLEAVEYLARWRGATVGYTAAEAFILGRKVI